MKLKKVAYCNSLFHLSLSIMHEVVGEAILPNIFSKTAQLHLKNSFISEVELCQTNPKVSMVLQFLGIHVGPSLVPEKFCKIFQIPHHIESLDVCMEY